MARFGLERVLALPEIPAPSTMYIVKGQEAGFAELYFTNNDGTETRRLPTRDDISSMISTALSGFNSVKVVATINDRDALVLERSTLVLVLDAASDETVINGAALYVYDFDNSMFHKVSEFESLDVVLSWENIQNGPMSSVEDIDDAVNLRHQHTNLSTLNKLGETGDGFLEFNGEPVGAYVAIKDW